MFWLKWAIHQGAVRSRSRDSELWLIQPLRRHKTMFHGSHNLEPGIFRNGICVHRNDILKVFSIRKI